MNNVEIGGASETITLLVYDQRAKFCRYKVYHGDNI